MTINQVNAATSTFTAALLKPIKETKSKKLLDTIRLQHPQEGKDFTMNFVNNDGKIVCNLCKNTYEKMNALYQHMKFHFDGDWKIFFTSQPKTVTVDKEAKVVNSMEPPLRWALTRKRTRRALLVDDIDSKVYKGPIMEVHDPTDLEGAENLLVLGYGDHTYFPEPSVTQRQIHAEESEGGSKVCFKFDLNQTPPMDMEAEDLYYLEEFRYQEECVN
ncbi:unnamed protein product [Lactuca saligna]|uniref:C2H2-type domain-containing protein n=1 Tax=Lactuca saligna TaxID=75948 RepID=A0AA35YAD1_LACSI|nr:unnamed protein product [Lactuca saligna]